jgi:exopolyphosphatase / guanosine-5'-triphosphate,3'-diphosphate pyrophosphatase
MPGSSAAPFWQNAKRSNCVATRAVIDIGTNSVKLLVAEVQAVRVDPLFEDSEQTRLGAGFYETHRLLPESISKTAEAVRAFVDMAEQFGPVSLDVIATSAARDAVNQSEFVEAIRREAKQELKVISGEQEADWAFHGVASDPKLANEPLLVMDIGGGSTEFVVGAKGERRAGRSFQVGSVRLLEKFRPSDPPTAEERDKCLGWLRKFFADEIKPFLREHLGKAKPTLVSTGGTASILGRLKWKLLHYDREKIEGTILSARELAEQTAHLWSLPLQERKRLPGMPGSRADVIIMGVAILEAATEALGFSAARISTRGLRYGALLHAEKFGSI